MKSNLELLKSALLALMADGCYRAHDDLEEACGGTGYLDALDQLIDEGRVGVAYTCEYGDIFWRPDVKPVEGGAQ